MHREKIKKFLISGTMRGGSSLVSNIFNAHSKVLALGEFIHFFRFLYRESEIPTPESFGFKLEEMRLRLLHRYGVEFNSAEVLSDTIERGLSYQNLYESILNYYLGRVGKEIGAEDAALNWTTIPSYLNLFPEGKVVQIVRDPRAVLASWGKSSYHKVKYLDAIFNCIDNMDKALFYSQCYSKDSYMFVRYEDVVLYPEETIEKLCKFIDIEIEPLMLRPQEWDTVFDGVLMRRGWSSHAGSMRNRGFEEGRVSAWREKLEDWELSLCETLAGERLKAFGYEFVEKKYSREDIDKGLKMIREDEFLSGRYLRWFTSDQGAEGYPEDPVDPRSWGGSEDYTKRFIDTPKGKEYLHEVEVAKIRFESQKSDPCSS